MSDPRRPEGPDSSRPGSSQPQESAGQGYYPPPDPAYAGQYNYPAYLPTNSPTRPLPTYWTQTQQPLPEEFAQEPEQPQRASRRWLWIGATTAVVLVAGLVIALVIANDSSRPETVAAPTPPETTTAPRTTERPVVPPSTRRSPAPIPIPIPFPTTTAPTPSLPGTTEPRVPGATDTVVYSVSGEGRAISITYIDAGGIMQIEFNVPLPWSRQVSLDSPAVGSARLSVLNVGREVTCSLTVNGKSVRQSTGVGLTTCSSRR